MNRCDRRSRGHRGPLAPRQPKETTWAWVAAWAADEAALPEARTGTHDNLIALLGARRRGGVRWGQWTGAEAVAQLGQLQGEAYAPAVANYLRAIGGHLREYGGWLVVATAPGELS